MDNQTTTDRRCPNCNGTGEMETKRVGRFRMVECNWCEGTGASGDKSPPVVHSGVWVAEGEAALAHAASMVKMIAAWGYDTTYYVEAERKLREDIEARRCPSATEELCDGDGRK